MIQKLHARLAVLEKDFITFQATANKAVADVNGCAVRIHEVKQLIEQEMAESGPVLVLAEEEPTNVPEA
jgi:hypothetical protein